MLPINIYELVQVPINLKEESHKTYLNYLTKSNNYHDIKEHELKSLQNLVDSLKGRGLSYKDYGGYYYSYHIPQISKEFDLLRVCNDIVINIELKSNKVNLDRALRQLIQNRHYLKPLDKRVYNYVYTDKTKKLYKLTNENKLEEIKIDELIVQIKNQNEIFNGNLDTLFDVSNYLVSPFNDTEKFLENMYFLTDQQEEFKKDIINKLKNKELISLKGSAGTGKTLLVYDIARTLSDDYNVCIIHCANLNHGQHKINKEKAFKIYRIKYLNKIQLEKYDFVLVDESQRIYKEQLDYLINKQKDSYGLLLSHDKNQYLNKKEVKDDVVSKIEGLKDINIYQLSETIRTNKNISYFSERVIYNDNKKKLHVDSNEIIIKYAKSKLEAKHLIREYKKDGFQFINYTPSIYPNESWSYFSDLDERSEKKDIQKIYNNPHRVIGQEYDKVLLTLGEQFRVVENVLHAKKHNRKNYDYKRMLYQILTRARKKLCIIIYNNEDLFDSFISLLK